MIDRPHNWPDLLDAHLAHWRAQPFEWGKGDCAQYAASWLTQLGYPHPLAGLPAWSSPLTAARVQRSMGGFRAAITAQLVAAGCPEIPFMFAMRGDLALVRIDHHRQALGIVTGPNVACHGSAEQVLFPLLGNAVTAWRI